MNNRFAPPQATVRHIEMERPEGDVVRVLHEVILSSGLHGIYTVRCHLAAEFTRLGPRLTRHRIIYSVYENDNLETPCTTVAVQEVCCAPLPTVSPDQSGVGGAIADSGDRCIAL